MQSFRFAVVWLGAGLLSACGALSDDAGAGDVAPGDLASARRAVVQRAFVKASNTGGGDLFGYSIALSADGSTLAVGAIGERSAAGGIDGDQANNAAPNAGAVYVYRWGSAGWAQEGYLKASVPDAWDAFGYSVALSADGSTLAVGAPFEDSAALGVGGAQDNYARDSGAVYVFARSGAAWHQQAYVKASNTGAGDAFGYSVALSADGSTLAVGAPGEDSAAGGVGDELARDAGAVYLLARSGETWQHAAQLKASTPGPGDGFGLSVALSGDGATLAVGAPGEDGAASGVGGDLAEQASNSLADAGAAYLFTLAGGAWCQEVYVKAGSPGAGDLFGYSVALSGDGSTLAVGAMFEDSDAIGVGGDAANDRAVDSGAVYLFARGGGAWSQAAYVKASNTDARDAFGAALALSADGATLAVGAVGEGSAIGGINGDQADDAAWYAGAAYVFTRSDDAAWSQQTYVKAGNPGASDQFGRCLALTDDGSRLVVGAPLESSAATGAQSGGPSDRDPPDDSAPSAGAAYMFDRRL